MLKRLLPFILILFLCMIFFIGLNRVQDTSLPSTLITKPLPKFKLPILIGEGFIRDNIFIGKASILIVWGSWCDSCIEENEFLLTLKEQGINIYGLIYKDNPAAVRKWIKVWGNPYRYIIYDKNNDLAKDLGVYGAPEIFLIDEKGIIRYKHIGVLDVNVWKEHFAQWF